ncbi:MAG: T9SS type A sorting domain-containing protein [Bacteroidia bacterium]|nr:T9SS type A sorting domain-containing protein [Bacteroidia bacterium]
MKIIFTFFLSVLFCVGISFAQFPPTMNGISGPSGVCSSAAETFTANATGTITSYSWSFAGPASGVVIGSPNSSVTTISFPFPYVNTTYTLHCVAYNGSIPSVTSASMIITVYETPNVSFSGATSFCQGSSTNLSASPTILSSSSTLSYNWSPSTGLNTTTGPNVVASPPATTNYTVLLTLGNCTNTAMVTVNVMNCGTVGLPELNNSEIGGISVFPNPGSEFVVLKSQKDVLAVILDQIGKEVRSLKLVAGEETRINGLNPGVYFVLTPETRKKVIITK